MPYVVGDKAIIASGSIPKGGTVVGPEAWHYLRIGTAVEIKSVIPTAYRVRPIDPRPEIWTDGRKCWTDSQSVMEHHLIPMVDWTDPDQVEQFLEATW